MLIPLTFFFSSPPPHPERPGAEAAGEREKESGPSSWHTRWDTFIWEHELRFFGTFLVGGQCWILHKKKNMRWDFCFWKFLSLSLFPIFLLLEKNLLLFFEFRSEKSRSPPFWTQCPQKCLSTFSDWERDRLLSLMSSKKIWFQTCQIFKKKKSPFFWIQIWEILVFFSFLT